MAKARVWLAWQWPDPWVAKEGAGLPSDGLWRFEHRNNDVAVDDDGATGNERASAARVMAAHMWCA